MGYFIRPNSHDARGGKSRLARFLMIVLWLAATPLPAQQTLPPTLAALFDKGVRALKEMHLDEAETCFQEVLRQGGKQAFVYNNLGIVYQRRGHHRQALEEFRAAINLDPAYASPRILLGASLLALGEVPDATRQLENAIKLEPHDPLAHLELAKAYERAGNVIGMVEEYQFLEQSYPDNAEYIYQLGRAYQKLGAWSFDELFQRNPGSARVFEAKADNYQAQGQMDLAIRFYLRAAQLDPKLAGIHLALAQIYMQQENPDEARKELQQELAIVPDSVSARALEKELAGTAGHN
jgi:tetratricopeptide (TPR) repeat protein